MNDREKVLSRIKKTKVAFARKGTSPASCEPGNNSISGAWEEIQRQNRKRRKDLIDSFERESRSQNVYVHRAEDLGSARSLLTSLLRDAGAQRAIIWDNMLPAGLGVEGVLDSLGIEHAGYGKGPGQTVSRADIGISGADYALAESGTLVLRSLPGQDRSTSLLPPIHVAFLESHRVINSLDELLVKLKLDWAENRELESCLTLVTGPSKTADIELKLVLGVHGPGEVRVILMDSVP